MGTRSAAFTAKIKNLNDYQMRLVQNTVPLPSGTDIANTFKYFTTTLLGVLKDVPGRPMIMMKNRENDTDRMALFPNLDYKGLHTSLIQMLDLVPLLPSGLYDFGKGFLSCLCSLIPFLERELIDTLPYIVASTLTVFPASLTDDIIDVLCWNLLPFTVSSEKPIDNFVLPKDGEPARRENYASNSAAAILMMVFQFVKDDTTIHRKITECFMAFKEDLVKDLLCVIAHGTPSSRIPAANLLFYYWPGLNPTHYDRRNAIGKFNTCETWSPPACCYKDCPGVVGKGNNGNNNPNHHHHLQAPNDAVKVCLDHSVSLFLYPDRPPIAYFCHECFVTVSKKLLSKSELNAISTLFVDINHPIQQVDITCENKNCRAQEKIAVSTCFSPECTSYNGNRPIRYCNQCHKIRHNTRRGADHVIHVPLTSPWELEPETQNYLVKAIISLLKEARPFGSGKRTDKEESMQRTMAVLDVEDDENDEAFLNERRLLSRYGVWLLVGLIKLEEDTPHEIIGHMLSMLFEWFNTTAYLPNDKTGTALEKLKSEYLPAWIQATYRSHADVFMACLLPNPPDYAKVGGHWDVLTSRMTHIKEGLIRLFCLVPYDVITLDVWNKVMPHWMEAIHIVVPKDELCELKRVFCKIFDPDMSPLGFDAREMYQFISIRFKSTPQNQRQALQWLQKLCLLHISIPLDILFEMFTLGVETMCKSGGEGSEEGPITTDSKNESLIINFEWEVDDYATNIHGYSYPKEDETRDEPNATILSGEKKLTCYNLMVDVLNSQLDLQDVEKYVGLMGVHASEVLGLINKMLSAEWFGFITQVLSEEDISEDEEEAIRGISDIMADFLQLTHTAIKNIVTSDPTGDSDDDIQDTVQSVCSDPKDSKERLLKKGPGLGGLMAALTTMQSTVEKAKDNLEETASETSSEDEKDYSPEIDELDIPVKLLYHLLIHNVHLNEPDMRFYLLDSVKLLTLHADVLQNIVRKRKRFIRWCQEPLLVGVMWKILDSGQSQVAQVAVPILLHSITLPGGSDAFWKSIDDDFQDKDWRVRFAAVEKTTVIFRFLEIKSIRKSQSLRSSLSHAFCCLIACMNDINPEVSLRASLYLGTIHDSAISSLIHCLENQFDNVPIDRPVILRRLYQLFNCLIDRKIITWQFFANRFENLILELQNATEKQPPDSAYQTLVRSADMNQKKDKDGGTTVYSLSASLKYPYKRTISAPAGMGLSTKTGNSHKVPVESTNQLSTGQTTPAGGYYRQQSVPLLKRKASKHGHDSVHQLNKQISNVGTVVDEMEYINVAAKTVDLDEIDKETLHLTVFLFMQFLSHPEQASLATSDEKQTSKTNPSTKAIQSLYSLLGFNEHERRFTTMPHKIRSTPAVNAFLSNLPQVLDNNFKIGEILLPNIILVLQKLPFPQLCATSWQTGYTLMQESHLFQGCGYSLWHLEPSARKSWLSAALVMVYKYNYPPEEVVSERLIGIIRIIIHTLAAQAHVCDRYSKPVLGISARSRDLSQISLGQADNDNDTVFDGESNLQDDEDNDKVDNNGTQEEGGSNLIVVKEEDAPDKSKKSEEPNVMSNLFELLPRPTGNSSTGVPPTPYAPTPDHHQMTSEGLPDGWAMQLMHSGRTLFIDNANQTTTWIDPRTGRPAPIKNISGSVKNRLGGVVESPPSPLSLMDVITVGNPIAVDRPSTSSSSGSNCGVLSSPPPLPSEERLLPIGISRTSSKKNYRPHQNNTSNIIDRVWQVLGSLDTTECSGESIPLIEPNSGEKIQLVASVSRNEDDSLRDGEITEKYTGTVTHISKAKLDALLRTSGANSSNNYNSTATESPPTSPPKTTTPNAVPNNGQKKLTEKEKLNSPTSATVIEKPSKATTNIPAEKTTSKGEKQRRRKMNSANHQEPSGFAPENTSKASSVCGKKMKAAKTDSVGSLSSTRDNPLLLKHSALRVGEDTVVDRCSQCGHIKEEYSEEEIGLCIIVLNTFINREPGLAAPLLPEILLTVTRIARKSKYAWEFCDAPSVYVPSNCRSIARQFIRCVFHQLAPNGIFSLLFQMELSNQQRGMFFETIVSALLDFSEVNPSVPVLLFLQEMNERKTWTSDLLEVSLLNLACYLKFVPYDQLNIWNFVFPHAETFLRRLWTLSANPGKSSTYRSGPHEEMNTAAATNCLQTGGKSNEKVEKNPDVTVVLRQTESLFSIMASLLRMSGIQGSRSILDPLGKLISHTLQNSNVSFYNLLNVCHLCNKTFAKEKERLQLTRTVVFELISAIKFKSSIPDTNFLLLTNFVLQDCGGEVVTTVGLEEVVDTHELSSNSLNTGAGEALRNNLSDILDFLADVHSLSKVKSHVKGMNIGLNEDTLGGIIKASLAQYMAIEINRGGNGSRESRAVNRYLPWLFNIQSNALTQGPREFLDCVSHIRLLSWLLLGSVTISLKQQRSGLSSSSLNLNNNIEDGICTPIPLEASSHIADHVQVILAGFAEQSKSSVVHMCSLFHAFILCQLWTVYLEQTIITLQPRDESQVLAGSILLDFWGKVTPGILQLVSHSKVLAEMVNLHFLGLMEAFMECNSIILGKLMPLWVPVLFAYQSTLPDHVRVRLQAIQDYKPQSFGDLEEESTHNDILKKWLQRLQFKMGQIEMQASNVTQFFTV